MLDLDIPEIKYIISNPEEEVYTIKSVIESLPDNEPFSPLIVIYDTDDHRQLLVSVSSNGDFVDSVCRISEALHLFPALNAHAAVIAISSKLSYQDEVFDAINIFLLSEENAWSIILPYTRSSSGVTWLDEHAHINQIDEQEFDDQGKDMVSMFYMYINAESTYLNVSEILSYLSTTSAAVNFFDNDVPSYFDFSKNEMVIST